MTGDVELEAVYGDSYKEDLIESVAAMADMGVSARMAGDFPSREGHTISLFAEHSVTQDWTVREHGMLVTKDLTLGSFDDSFTIDNIDPTAANPAIIKMKAKDTLRSGSYRLNVTNWNPTEVNGSARYPRYMARAYVIVRDANGNQYTVYSPIHSIDYVYDTGSGGGTNYDDPFG